ncbi:WD40 repeat domain-containing protein [Microcoleus sp.]|uniref:WD40 repeat domain-containing protein n=1 Tax=Microcoleus sp. TaxID=44472 RepID=UPI00403EEE12
MEPQPLIEDYDLALTPDLSTSREEVKRNADNLRLIQGALRLSAHILEHDKTQLAGQLLGRLLSYKALEIQVMLEQAKQWKAVPWFRPLTPSLTQPSERLLRTLSGHQRGVNAVAVFPDGQQALSASIDATLKLWNLNNGKVLRTLTAHASPVMAVAVLPDGRQAVYASWDGILTLWSLSSGKLLCTFYGHNCPVFALALISKRRQAISAGADKTLKLWDINTGKTLRTLFGHTNLVSSVAVLPNGLGAISTSWDGTLKLWNLQSGDIIASLVGDSPLDACAVTPDAVTIVAGEQLGRVHFLRLEGM